MESTVSLKVVTTVQEDVSSDESMSDTGEGEHISMRVIKTQGKFNEIALIYFTAKVK